MKQHSTVSIRTVGLAIFTMLFGAGNIIYPIKAGVMAGCKNYIGILGFLLTGVMLPILGLIAMILFEGDYKAFFARIGKVPGFLAILFCMFIIGPLLVMPRCITVPYDMLAPFFPSISLTMFSVFFAVITLLLTYKESNLLDILGKYMSWLLIGSLGFIIVAGIIQGQSMMENTQDSATIFFEQVLHGFQTLDLIGALFFAFMIVRLIKLNSATHITPHKLALMGLKGGMITATLMTAFYVGFSYLGAYYAHVVTPDMNGAEMFRNITLEVIGHHGIAVLLISVVLACLSTFAALASVFADYLRKEIFNGRISYHQSLIANLILTVVISNFGLSNILKYGFPVVNFGYPIIVSITLCNMAYKLFNIQTIKIPVLLTTLTMIGIYAYPYFATAA